MDNVEEFLILKDTKPEDMTIKNIVACLLLFFAVHEASAQKIDSLKALLDSANDQDRIEALFGLSSELILTDNRQALCYALDGYALSIRLKDSLQMVRTGLMVGSALRRSHQLDSSLLMYGTIISICERNGYRSELAIALNSAGTAYTNKAYYDKALECYFKSLGLRQEAGDTSAQIVAWINIGVVYYKLKNYAKALEIFLRCRDLQKHNGWSDEDDLLLLNIGHAYAYLGKSDEALSE